MPVGSLAWPPSLLPSPADVTLDGPAGLILPLVHRPHSRLVEPDQHLRHHGLKDRLSLLGSGLEGGCRARRSASSAPQPSLNRILVVLSQVRVLLTRSPSSRALSTRPRSRAKWRWRQVSPPVGLCKDAGTEEVQGRLAAHGVVTEDGADRRG